jgi:hypothetical protein
VSGPAGGGDLGSGRLVTELGGYGGSHTDRIVLEQRVRQHFLPRNHPVEHDVVLRGPPQASTGYQDAFLRDSMSHGSARGTLRRLDGECPKNGVSGPTR